MIFGTKARQLSRAERCAMVECVNPALPISQQCRLLALPRSSVYRKPAEISAEDCDYGADRSALSGPALLRLAPDDGVAGNPRPSHQPQASAAPDAAAGTGGDLPAPEYEQAGSGTPDLSLPAARAH